APDVSTTTHVSCPFTKTRSRRPSYTSANGDVLSRARRHRAAVVREMPRLGFVSVEMPSTFACTSMRASYGRDQNRDRVGEHDPVAAPVRSQAEAVVLERVDEHAPDPLRVPRLGERPLEQPLQLRLELVERRARRREADLGEEPSQLR